MNLEVLDKTLKTSRCFFQKEETNKKMEILYNDTAISLWTTGILISIIILVVLWHRTHNLSFLFFLSIFEIYVLFAIDKVFFPIQINGLYVDVMKTEPIMSQINLVPFYFDQYGLTPASFWGIVNNIILTVPFGFGLNFIMRLRTRNFIWLAFALGLGFEITQLIISLVLRYPYRTIDVNDVLMNATGVLLGYGLFRIFALLYLAITKRFEIKHEGLSAYIYDVASRVQTAIEVKNA